jgi:hypothetical protein
VPPEWRWHARKPAARSAGDDHIPADDPRGWQTISSSAIAFGDNLPKAWTLFLPDSVPPVAQGSGIKRY